MKDIFGGGEIGRLGSIMGLGSDFSMRGLQSALMRSILWTPAEITSGLWLDAADPNTITLVSSAVSQWADKSGNSRHATQGTSGARPTVAASAINGKDALAFDGVDDFLTLGTELGRPSNYTVFSVSKITRALSNVQAVIAAIDSSGNSRNSCMSVANDGGAAFWQYGYNGLMYRWGYGAGGFTLDTVAMHCLTHTNGTQDESVYRNGNMLTNDSLAGTATANSGTAYSASIGRLGDFNGWYFGGNIAEVVVILSAISAEDRQKIEGYMAHKWGLVSSLPSDHPYKLVAPTL